jgi:hypothetical protein
MFVHPLSAEAVDIRRMDGLNRKIKTAGEAS